MADGRLTAGEAAKGHEVVRTAAERLEELYKLPDRQRTDAWALIGRVEGEQESAARQLDEFLENDDRAEIPLAMSGKLQELETRVRMRASAEAEPGTGSEELNRRLTELEAYARATMQDGEAGSLERARFRFDAMRLGSKLSLDSLRRQARANIGAVKSWFETAGEE